MPDERAYRILVRFEPGEQKFIARVPEMDIEATAGSRADAVTSAEELIETHIAQAAGSGEALPEPCDTDTEGGELTLKLSPTLLRELTFYSNTSGLSPEELGLQILSYGLGRMEGQRPFRAAKPPPPKGADESAEERGEASEEDQRRRRPRRRKEGYRPDLDGQANFLEYLRGLDKGRGRR